MAPASGSGAGASAAGRASRAGRDPARGRRARPRAPRGASRAGRPRWRRRVPRPADGLRARMRRRWPACRRTRGRGPPGAAGAARAAGRPRRRVATSSWRIASRSSGSRRTNPCSMASARPAARSPSSRSVPRLGMRRGPGREAACDAGLEGGRRDGQLAVVSGRSAGASSRRRRRHSGERRVSRAATRSAKVPVRVAFRSSRRAATSSSTTSGRAAGPLRHQDDDGGRRPLALDALDEPGDLAAREGSQVHANGWPEARADDRQVLAERVLARQPIGLVREQQRDPLLAGDPGNERREGPGRGVGDVEVLERQHHRVARPRGDRASAAAPPAPEAAGARDPRARWSENPRRPRARPASAGSSRRMGPASRRSRATSSACGRVTSTGSSAASTDAHGGSAGP